MQDQEDEARPRSPAPRRARPRSPAPRRNPTPSRDTERSEILAVLQGIQAQIDDLNARLPDSTLTAAAKQSASSASSPVALAETESRRVHPQGTSRNSTTSNFITTAAPVGFHLKPAVRADIINGVHVDFKNLLPLATPASTPLSFKAGGKTITISDEDKTGKPPISFIDWCRAWNIFSSILGAHSNIQDINELLAKHFETVLDLHRKNHWWRYYDNRVRELIAAGFTQWGNLHLPTYLEATTQPRLVPPTVQIQPTVSHQQNSSQPKTEAVSSERLPFIPQSFCQNFHKGLNCKFNPCRFKHVCFQCNQNHPIFSCPLRSHQAQYKYSNPSSTASPFPDRATPAEGGMWPHQ